LKTKDFCLAVLTLIKLLYNDSSGWLFLMSYLKDYHNLAFLDNNVGKTSKLLWSEYAELKYQSNKGN